MIRILVVDDQKFTRKVINSVLETENGFIIVGEAKNGIEALELMNQVAIDVAIVDLEMPEMDGFKLTEKIYYRFPHTKVIIFSSTQDKDSINKAVKSGARGYLLKNITSKDQIIDTINQVQRGYFQLGPGLFESLISGLIGNKEEEVQNLFNVETKLKKNLTNLRSEISFQNQQMHDRILDELDAEIVSMKVEFKQGLTDFQDRVSKQLKSGFEDFTYNYQQNRFVPELWQKRYLQLSQNINFIESQYNLSINKLKEEVTLLRYLVIFLLIVLVPIVLFSIESSRLN
jgi:DNA-binding NarL/FixJ family response regulator